MNVWLRALLLVVPVFLTLGAPEAQALRAALIVGNNVGHGSDANLRYAEADAERMSNVLVQLGGFGAAEAVLLKGRSSAMIRQALASLGRQLAAAPGEHLFFFYYSGHADGRGLHVGPDLLAFTELRELLLELPVAVRVVIVDACQSGVFTRLKGGRPAPAFSLAGIGEAPRGLAILASSSDTELAQESDELRGSFFTHHLEVGLRGLADRNRDGRVALAESFDYASDQTLQATLSTAIGPQHPSFRYDLVGHTDIVLTVPQSQGSGSLIFDRPGWFFVRRESGPVVAEIVSRGGEQIALEPGRYELTRRDGERVETATAVVTGAGATRVSTLSTRSYAFGRAVRKGGGARSLAYSLSLGAVVRSSLASLGPAVGASLTGRIDGADLSLELRAQLAQAESSTLIRAQTRDTGLALAPLKVWDLGAVTLAAGGELGWTLFRQSIADGSGRLVHAAAFGPTAVFEVPLGTRFCLRGDLTALAYLLDLEAESGREALSWVTGARAGFGAGGYF